MKPAKKDKIIKKDIIFVKCITFTLRDVLPDILPELRKEIKNYIEEDFIPRIDKEARKGFEGGWREMEELGHEHFLDYLEEKFCKKTK